MRHPKNIEIFNKENRPLGLIRVLIKIKNT
ncbi:MAG: hypothetical protein ACJAQX_001932 [Polaribacter sp.]|jgi:hypothetical protein